MTEQISQRELRNDSGRVMRELDAGTSFVVTSNGRPVGELRPIRREQFVDTATVLEIFRGAPPIDAEAFRRDVDSVIDQDIEPRG